MRKGKMKKEIVIKYLKEQGYRDIKKYKGNLFCFKNKKNLIEFSIDENKEITSLSIKSLSFKFLEDEFRNGYSLSLLGFLKFEINENNLEDLKNFN
jgi:hypothetical protein